MFSDLGRPGKKYSLVGYNRDITEGRGEPQNKQARDR